MIYFHDCSFSAQSKQLLRGEIRRHRNHSPLSLPACHRLKKREGESPRLNHVKPIVWRDARLTLEVLHDLVFVHNETG